MCGASKMCVRECICVSLMLWLLFPSQQQQAFAHKSSLEEDDLNVYYSVSPLKSLACTVCQSGVLHHKLTMLTVRFRLGTDLMPQLPPPHTPLHLLRPFKSGFCIVANHSTNIFPNRNPMTQGDVRLILALPEIVVRPQIWHDNFQSQRRRST